MRGQIGNSAIGRIINFANRASQEKLGDLGTK